MTSWRVTASISWTRVGESLPRAARATSSAVPAGTSWRASIARHAASSTSSHSSNLAASVQIAANAGRL